MKDYTYVGSLNGAEEVITNDEQLLDCIAKGGTILAVDDEGDAVFIGDSKGFPCGRPCFLHFTKSHEKRGKEYEDLLRNKGAKRLAKREESGKVGFKIKKKVK